MSTDAITDEDFFDSENDLLAIFGLEAAEQPRPQDVELTAEHETRIDNIVEEALHEAVVKDTTAFFFKTFGVGLSGLAHAMFSSLCDLSDDGDAEGGQTGTQGPDYDQGDGE